MTKFLCMLFRLCDFFRNFFHVTKDSSLHFLIFCNRTYVKKISKCPPFTVIGIVRFFKSNNFRLKIRFSQAQHPISDLFFFRDRCFFYATFFSNLFSSKPQFSLETKRFASIKHCSRFSALCDLLETFIKKIFRKIPKIFYLNFLFLIFLL